MAKIKAAAEWWLQQRQMGAHPGSVIAALIAFITLLGVNWEWTVAPPLQNGFQPVYNLNEMAVISFAATMSWVAFVIVEGFGMILGGMMLDKADEKVRAAQAEADARVKIAQAEADARVKAAQAEAAEARASAENGATLAAVLNYLAAERTAAAEREAAREAAIEKERARWWEILQNAGVLNGASAKEDTSAS